ncbi:MAG TPA: hypothetical protein VGN67_05045 [Telluribacter sp.]|nr:hypothetical protein [Telluribacter sp.]
MTFRKDSVSFSIMSNGGLIYPMEGYGVYRLTDNLLIVRTDKNTNKPSQQRLPRELGDRDYLENRTLVFKINNMTENQLELVLIGISENANFKTPKTIRDFERDHKKFIYQKRLLKKK